MSSPLRKYRNRRSSNGAGRKIWLEKKNCGRISETRDSSHLPLGFLERLWPLSRNRSSQLSDQLFRKVWFCPYQCRDPREIHVVGRNIACWKEDSRQTSVIFDTLELCPFCCHFNGLPSFGGNYAQVVARAIRRRELFRDPRGPARYICDRTSCVCGVNS